MTGERPRVMIVDDEENVRQLLQRILAEAGYEVTAATSQQR
jgi:CheY-like chemotaxis protein